MAQKYVFTAAGTGIDRELWITDGTTTSLLKDINSTPNNGFNPELLTALGDGRVLFSASTTGEGSELWITDGTTTGTKLLKDINVGGGDSSISNLTALGNGRAIFNANDGINGERLWVTNGETTSLLANILPNSSNSAETLFAVIGNGKAVFSANDGTNGPELWVSDGTPGGTSRLTAIAFGNNNSSITSLKSIGGGKALFSADDGTTGAELYITNGTAAGTYLLKDIRPGTYKSSTPNQFTSIGTNKTLFTADDGTGRALWITNGTEAGTSRINTSAGSTPSSITELTAFGSGKAVFSATNGSDGLELWITDGTAANTKMLKDISDGSTGSGPTGFTSFTDARGVDKVIFSAKTPGENYEVWVSDGTTAGTTLLKDINPGSGFASNAFYFKPTADGKVLFRASDGKGSGDHGYEVWITDGTTAGTKLLKDINPGTNDSSLGYPDFTPVGTSTNPPPTTPGAPTLAAASDTGVSSADRITKDTTPTFTGKVTAGATVTLYDGTTVVGTATAGSTGVYNVTSSTRATGVHGFKITATVGGSVSAASATTSVTIDTTLPGAPSKPVLAAARDTGASNTDGITRSTTLAFSGTAEAGSTVSLYEGTKVVGSAVATTQGAYSIGVAGVAEGKHSYAARAVDKAGNTSTSSAVSAVTVDLTKPNAVISNKGGSTTTASLKVSGTGEAGSTISLTNNGKVVGTSTVLSNGVWSQNVTLASGANRFVATDTDKAGNVGVSAAVNYNYAPATARMAAANPVQASLAQALFDASFSAASYEPASMHEAMAVRPTLAAES